VRVACLVGAMSCSCSSSLLHQHLALCCCASLCKVMQPSHQHWQYLATMLLYQSARLGITCIWHKGWRASCNHHADDQTAGGGHSRRSMFTLVMAFLPLS
jgi:hypothetical protein